MSFSLLSIALFILVVTIVAVEIYRYINRGFNKSLLFLSSNIISIILTMTLSPAISGAICTFIFDTFIKNMSGYAELSTQMPSLDILLVAVFTAVLNTLLFVGIFFIMRKCVRIVIGIICRAVLKKNKTDSGYAKPQLHSVVDGAIDEVLEACSTTDENSIKPNLTTLINLYALIVESGIMNVDASNYPALIAFIDDSDIINKVNAELAANAYMSNISVSSIAMSAIADSISVEALGEENYNILMSNIASALDTVNSRGYGSAEEKVEVMTTYAQKYISEYNLDVPDTVAELIAEELLTILESSDDGKITVEDVSKLINSYQ